MEIKMIKCHGTGNDFILIDEISHDYGFTEEQRRDMSILLCDRENGIGADGILFVLNSYKYDGRMRIFNSDGTEPEMCGNGLRCVGRYVLELLGKDEAVIETMKAHYNVKVAEELFKGVKNIEITIDTVSLNPKDLPLLAEGNDFLFRPITELSNTLEFSAFSITNPHLVTFVDKVDIDEVIKVGEKANSRKGCLPKGVNVNFVRKIDEDNIYVKTYERGVGLTKSCGTGMTSSSVAFFIKEGKKEYFLVNIYNDGGMIKCRVHEIDNRKYSVDFIGNATYVYGGAISLEDNKFSMRKERVFEEENTQYDKFLEFTSKVISEK